MDPTRTFRDVVTYWAGPVSDGYGHKTFLYPIQLLARWEDKNEEFTTPTGEKVVSRSVVWVPQDVDVGGWLFLGTDITVDPAEVLGAAQIRAFLKVPDIRRSTFERRAML